MLQTTDGREWWAGLVWKGRVVKRMNTPCESEDYLCSFGCDCPEETGGQGTFTLFVCSRLFTWRRGNRVEIPMVFQHEDGKRYDTRSGRTPMSLPWTWPFRFHRAVRHLFRRFKR